MNSGLRQLIAMVGLVWGFPLLAIEPGTVAEIQEVLRVQALSVPAESQLRALEQGDLLSRLKAIDPWTRLVLPGADITSRAGIGAELYKSGQRTWLMPYVNGPLFHAGIKDRAELYKVNGERIAGMPLPEIARSLLGDAGEVLQVEICEPPCKTPRVLPLVLEETPVSAVEEVEVAGQRIIRVRGFIERETKIFLETLLDQGASDAPLILDLRDCQGGDFFEAMDSASLFLPAGSELAQTYDRHGIKQRYYAPPSRHKVIRPLTIWISGETASAGEIFAGILQQQGRARLVGMKSRGKCVSQTIKTLTDGSLFYFTNLEIRLPGGVICQGVGIEPDITLDVEELQSSRLILDHLQSAGVR